MNLPASTPTPSTDHEYILLISSQMTKQSLDIAEIRSKLAGDTGVCSRVHDHEKRLIHVESDIISVKKEVNDITGWKIGVMAILAFLTFVLVAAGRYLDLFFG